jgi:hypothetical protein
VAEHATTGTVEGPGGTAAQPVVGAAHDLEHFSGRPISWFGTGVVCAGSVVGAIPFFFTHPIWWWLFWVGAGITVVGCLVLAFAKTMSEDWY